MYNIIIIAAKDHCKYRSIKDNVSHQDTLFRMFKNHMTADCCHEGLTLISKLIIMLSYNSLYIAVVKANGIEYTVTMHMLLMML